MDVLPKRRKQWLKIAIAVFQPEFHQWIIGHRANIFTEGVEGGVLPTPLVRGSVSFHHHQSAIHLHQIAILKMKVNSLQNTIGDTSEGYPRSTLI